MWILHVADGEREHKMEVSWKGEKEMLRTYRDMGQSQRPALASGGRRDNGFRQTGQHQALLSWASMPFLEDQTMRNCIDQPSCRVTWQGKG